jgi:hypothetical protein
MHIVSTFHIIVIIYQSFNVNYFGKFEQQANFKHFFHPFSLHRNFFTFFSNFMFNLQ